MLLNHSPLRRFDEADQQIYVFAVVRLGLQLDQRLGSIQLRGQENFVRVMDLGDALFGEPFTLETDGVQAISVGVAGGCGFRKGQNIAGDGRATSDERIGADMHEMMHGTKRADNGVILDDNMTAEGRGVCHDYIIPDLAIMRDVGISHDQVMAANTSYAAAFYRSAVDGDKFANGVVISDLETCGFAGVSYVLWRETDRTKWKKAVIGTNFARPLEGDMRLKMAPFAEFDVRPDYAIGTNFAGGSNPGSRIDNRSRVSFHPARIM